MGISSWDRPEDKIVGEDKINKEIRVLEGSSYD